MSTLVDDKGVSRLSFLKASGALVIAFSLPLTLEGKAFAAASPGANGPVDSSQLDSYLAIGPDGAVTVYSGKVELGSGAVTGMAQIVAEELDVPLSRITMITGTTSLTPDLGPTFGSNSIAHGGPVMRQVAADARYALLERAAATLGVPMSQLTVKDGVVSITGNGARSITYADLIGGKHFDTKIPVKDLTAVTGGFAGVVFAGGKGTPKKPSEYSLVGQSAPRIDIHDKVTGAFTFNQDVRVPGMLHGRVVRPTGIYSKLLSVGKAPAGVRVVREGDFLGVVAENEWDAIQAAQNISVKWSDWTGLPKQAEIYETVRALPSKYSVAASAGAVDTALAAAKTTLQASYLTPMESHASLGPSCAIADVHSDHATIWAGTQSPYLLRGMIAELLGLPADKVNVIVTESAGCYGRNGADPVCADAAIMSRLAGKPVRVQWMRWDEHGWDPKGPPTVHDLVGGLDAKGNLSAWHHEIWVPSTSSTMMIGSVLAGHPVGMVGKGGWTGPLMYDLANFDQVAHSIADFSALPGQGIGIISAWLRDPVQSQTTFAMESFFDELAAAAGVDPVQFRLRYLKDKRLIALLRAVVKQAGWQSRPSPRKGALTAKDRIATGRGVAVALRDGTYNAGVAEVQVNRVTGKVNVTRFVIGQDNGLSINPRALKLTMEAGVTQTTSRTLWEEVTFDQSNITSTTWATYPILTFVDAPVIETVLIDHPELPATGAGEPACSVVPGAIGNAVFDAIGVRIRQLPMRPDRVKAAIQQAVQAAAATKG